MPTCSPNLVEDQSFTANSKITQKIGTWHSSFPLRIETAVATTTSGRPNYRIQDIHGSFGCGSELFFLPNTRRGLRMYPFSEG